MVFKLKHGEFEADLNICNRSYRMAVMQAEASGIDLFSGSNLASANFLMDYAYHCYSVEFTKLGIKPPMDLIEFDEELSKRVESSNIVELMEALSQSVVSILSEATNNSGQTSGEEKKKGKSRVKTS